ncbi:MAG TPA: helicase-related protein, partial [Cryomorphaceae bacterium]|nr:helicase-related protein [Cryomorphaceae bacterium]
IVEQLIRPTGLPDPVIHVRPSENQIDDLMEEIDQRTKKNERVLVTTLTKRMAEELQSFFDKAGIKCRYIHSDVDTLDRVEIISQLREGTFDVLIGVNLLREGLDLPEVSLVAILDADKEGFLRSERSLVQTVGRAARNINGTVIMYADKVTDSMRKTIEETERRRLAQQAYNEEHDLVPQQIRSRATSVPGGRRGVTDTKAYVEPDSTNVAADPVLQYMSADDLARSMEVTKAKMNKAAKDQDFMEAARLRDELFALQKIAKEK